MMELKKKIVSLCNESGLPIEAILFVIKDIYRDAEESFITYKSKKLKEKESEKQDVDREVKSD